MSTLREAAIGAMGALETARNGLAWYRDRYPESTDGSDDEAAGDIDAAIDALRAELAKPDARPAPAEPQPTEAEKDAAFLGRLRDRSESWQAYSATAPQPAGGMRDFATEVGHWMRRSKEWRKRAEAAEAAEALLSTQPAGGEPQPAAQPEPVAFRCWHPKAERCYYVSTSPPEPFRSDTGEPNVRAKPGATVLRCDSA